MPEISLSELNIYPVKSLRQITLSSSKLEAYGLQHDRRWMIVDKNGKMITQRQLSKMCLVQPTLLEDGIQLEAYGMTSLIVKYPQSGKSIIASVWDDDCRAHDAGNEAAKWLSEFLSTDCRLVYFPDDEFRQVDLKYAEQGDRTAFSDGFPLLLISQASLDNLNQRLEKPIPMKRFRPNLVVSGCDAYEEDRWKRIKIGDITFRVVKPCSRCVIPTIDIDTAQRSNEPSKTLASYRMQDNKIFFGQNVIAEQEGKLALGMTVEIIE